MAALVLGFAAVGNARAAARLGRSLQLCTLLRRTAPLLPTSPMSLHAPVSLSSTTMLFLGSRASYISSVAFSTTCKKPTFTTDAAGSQKTDGVAAVAAELPDATIPVAVTRLANATAHVAAAGSEDGDHMGHADVPTAVAAAGSEQMDGDHMAGHADVPAAVGAGLADATAAADGAAGSEQMGFITEHEADVPGPAAAAVGAGLADATAAEAAAGFIAGAGLVDAPTPVPDAAPGLAVLTPDAAPDAPAGGDEDEKNNSSQEDLLRRIKAIIEEESKLQQNNQRVARRVQTWTVLIGVALEGLLIGFGVIVFAGPYLFEQIKMKIHEAIREDATRESMWHAMDSFFGYFGKKVYSPVAMIRHGFKVSGNRLRNLGVRLHLLKKEPSAETSKEEVVGVITEEMVCESLDYIIWWP